MPKSKKHHGSKPEWKLFEDAIGAFLQALDINAKVTNDAQTPDLDTGDPRQRDVWIETTFGGHIPIKILVSCKKKSRKLSQQDIDAFVGELRSSGANKGIIYSYGGFSAPALSKAKKLGISCCVLYENRPPDIPQILQFSAYCFQEMHRIRVIGGDVSTKQQVRDLLNSTISIDGREVQLSRALVGGYESNRSQIDKNDIAAAPTAWNFDLPIETEDQSQLITVRIEGDWRIYEAKIDAWLLNGSYSFENEDFKGSFSTPWVDRLGKHPGHGWEEINPSTDRAQQNVISMILYGGDLEGSLKKQYGF